MNNEPPKNWAISTMADVTNGILRGKSPKYTDYSALPVVNQRAIRWNGIQNEYLKYVHPDQIEDWAAELHIQEGDILWNSTGTGTIGRACLVFQTDLTPPKVVDSHVTVIRPNQEAIVPRYLYYWIRSPEIQTLVDSLYSGTTNQVELSRDAVAKTRVLLPPLNEQQRIADKLDALFQRVEACARSLNEFPSILERFRQSVLKAAVTGELTVSWDEKKSKWQQYLLGSLLLDIRYGTAKKSFYDVEDGTPVIRIPNIKEGIIDDTDLKYSQLTEQEIKKLALQAGDILLVRSNGSIDLVGKTAVVESRFEGYAFAGYLIRLRVDTSIVNPYYLYLFLMSSSIRRYITLTARSTSGVNNINSEEIRSIQISLPSLEEQDEIVRRVGSIFSYVDNLQMRYQGSVNQLEKLTPEILAMAFRGQLVIADPTDEPAALLLQRIRNAKAEIQSTSSQQPRRRILRVRDKDKLKVKDAMLTKKDITRSHLSDILKVRGPLTSEALWSASQLEIDDFYHQLRDEETNGLLREIKDGQGDANRLVEAI